METTGLALFIGSSSEGLDVARAIQTQLCHDCEVTVWNEGGFRLGQTTLEGLVSALDRFDFAIIVLTPDDKVVSREVERLAPRDNLLFELGLFMGRLGRARTLVVCPASPTMKLPSDLAGVTVARFSEDRIDKNLVAALGPAYNEVRQIIRELGVAEVRTSQRFQAVTTEMDRTSEKKIREIFLNVETVRMSHEVEGGWSSIARFGLAVAVTWDAQNRFRRWFEPDAKALISELARFDRIVSFNGDRFDFEVLSAYQPVNHLLGNSFNLLVDLHRRLGFRIKLDDLARETLGNQKTGNGLDIVQWWREGRKEEVCKYCETDVKLLVDLVEFARRNKYVVVKSRQLPVDWH